MPLSISQPTALHIRISVPDMDCGRAILSHLTEERLIAGGTVIQAESMNWVGGAISTRKKREVSGYTTVNALPLIQSRMRLFFENEPPVTSQFVMTQEKQTVIDWIERNVRHSK